MAWAVFSCRKCDPMMLTGYKNVPAARSARKTRGEQSLFVSEAVLHFFRPSEQERIPSGTFHTAKIERNTFLVPVADLGFTLAPKDEKIM